MPERDLDPRRVARVASTLAIGDCDPDRLLCSVSADVVGVTGAGVVLMSAGRAVGTLCVSDAMTAVVEDVQYTLGEGPCIDAFRSKAPVLVPDLSAVEVTRWPGFRAGALAAGVRAVFGFPLLVGTIGIGALNLYVDHPGDLSADQLGDAAAVAHVVGRAVLGWQSAADSGSVAWQLEQVPAHRAVVHQAAGMVSVQAAVSVDDALALLRAHAFAEGHRIGDVVADVVGGQLRFDDAGTTRPR
jgi:hypothetical protein